MPTAYPSGPAPGYDRLFLAPNVAWPDCRLLDARSVVRHRQDNVGHGHRVEPTHTRLEHCLPMLVWHFKLYTGLPPLANAKLQAPGGMVIRWLP